MFKLFEAKTKVQKNREIVRETDFRMAKYGRRGLIANILIFCLCLFISESFVEREPTLAIVLSAGLFVTTILRGYFLFRMDTLYSRAPAAWRNKYFLVTLLGSAWWSVIMISITLVLNMEQEAPLMWLYTVVFFSITAHAFSPFKRFLTCYQFIGIVPAALSTLLIGELTGIFYAAILLMFFWILHHHSTLMSDTYWEHLEANYNLTRKAETLEEEKRDTRESLELSTEYLGQLGAYLGAQGTDESRVQHASDSVESFHRILTKDVVPQIRVFNVRHLFQYLVRQHQDTAEQKGIEVETAISPALPSRLIGDPKLLGQVLDSIITQVIEQNLGDLIILEMEFTREFGTTGQLLVMATIRNSVVKRNFFVSSNKKEVVTSLDLVLAKGIADVLDGSLEYGDSAANNGKNLTFRAHMSAAEMNPRLDYHRVQYKNKPLLLINQNARWLDHKRLELDTLGFDVKTANDFKKAVTYLTQAINQGTAIETVVYTTLAGEEQAVDFANELLSDNDMKYINQFVICSRKAKKYFQERLISSTDALHFIDKPSGLYEFEMTFAPVFCGEGSPVDHKAAGQNEILWFGAQKRRSIFEALSAQAGIKIWRSEDKKQFLKLLQDNQIKLIVIDSNEESAQEIIGAAREYELSNSLEDLLPIVALGLAEQQRTMLEMGVDQFINADALIQGDTSELEFWLNIRHI